MTPDAAARATEDRRPRTIEIRIGQRRFRDIRAHLEDQSRGEEAGFLLCAVGRLSDRDVLLDLEWHPVPDEAVTGRHGRDDYVLAWHPEFNAQMVARADLLGAAVVLMHSHVGSARPGLSRDDYRNAKELFPSLSRILRGRPSGSVVLGERAAVGRFWRDGEESEPLNHIRIVGTPLETWRIAAEYSNAPERTRLIRQTVAIGAESDGRLRLASVAVIGVSGGGSHVCQQLAHQGFGRIVPVDDQLVEAVQLGRMVGATPADVGRSYKTAVMERLINAVDPDIVVEEVRCRVPARAAIEAIKGVDLVVGCVDTFHARADINALCRRYHVPLIDIGMQITTDAERLTSANGQIVVTTPDSPCLRCTPLLSEAVLARERQEKPPGYDANPEATGDPQVVSMNGVLASEAANAALDIATGYSGGVRGAGWWVYDGRRGTLTRAELPPRRRNCAACAEQGHGDPL